MLPAAVVLRGLRKTYKDVVAVDGLDLEVPPGECFGLLGPNGAGKTTTLEICEGLNLPDAGEVLVLVLGMDWRTGGRELRHRLGISLQETQFSARRPSRSRRFPSPPDSPRPARDASDASSRPCRRAGGAHRGPPASGPGRVYPERAAVADGRPRAGAYRDRRQAG